MQGKNFDIFISYRRSDGDEIAAKINETLKGNHYRCFFDFESLKDGRFDERIEKAIEDAPVFIALLTPHYLERPKKDGEKELSEEEKKKQEKDWVIREIECAIKNKRKIIPIDYNKKFVGYPESISEEIKKGLGGHNFAVVSSGQQYSRDMDALMEDWIGNTVPKPPERTRGKANIEVSSDVNCDILKAGEVIATVAKGGYNILKLPQGRHKLICRSNDFLDVQQKIVLEIDQDLADDFIEIELANEVQTLIEEKRRKEEEEIKRLEREKQIEQAVRRLVLHQPYNLKTLTGHSSSVFSIAESPDGKYLASGSDDGTIIIWDAESCQKLKTLVGHSWIVESVCFSPDGKYLASGSVEDTVIIWDAKSGERLKTLEGHSGSVSSVCWSPDGKYLASGSGDNNVIIWDANSGEKLQNLEGHSGWVNSVCFSPDGKYLASGSNDKTVIIWDANSGEKLQILEGHSSVVESVSWSPDGKYLASGSDDKTVIIWGVILSPIYIR